MTRQVELDVGGMTCASCAMRVEKRLNRLPGVQATVNYATEIASVTIDSGDVSTTELVAAVESAGYTAAEHVDPLAPSTAAADSGSRPEVDELRQRLIVSTVLTIPVALMAMVPALQFTYWQWASLALASPVVVWGALPFHRAAWVNIRHGAVTMDTLVSVGVSAAYAWSLWALFLGGAGMPGMVMPFELITRQHGEPSIYLEVASGVTVLILLGRYLEARAKGQSSAALRALVELGAKDVSVLRGDTEVRIPIEQLVVGDRFVVRPGEKIATDGVVDEGISAVDTALMTGEPLPVDVAPGSHVYGATVNTTGRLIVRATRVGSDTALAQIAHLVAQAQSGKAPVQRLADRVSSVFVPVVFGLSLATLVAWLLSGAGVEPAFTAAVAVLIIACPCALGLATPTALLVGTGRGAQLGILIKGPQVLESTRLVDTVVLDKTGTVTEGHMSVVDVAATDGGDADTVLRVAAAVETGSEHPIAQAIVAAGSRTGALPPLSAFQGTAGSGVRGIVDERVVTIGTTTFMRAEGIDVSADLDALLTDAAAIGRTGVIVAWDGRAHGAIVVADRIKSTSATAIAHFRELGLDPILLTGDQRDAAVHIASAVGIQTDATHVIAQVLPAEKSQVITRLQREGRVVAMVGDGINDAAALAQADLGIAMGTGTDVAIEASDLTLVRADLLAAVDAIRLSRRTLAVIKGNLFWAFAYNVAAIPLAALGLLNPLIAGGAMAFSSVFVVTNSLRLRRFDTVEDSDAIR